MTESQEHNILAFFNDHPARQQGLMNLIREITKDEENNTGNNKAANNTVDKAPISTNSTPKGRKSIGIEATTQPEFDTPGRSKRKRSEEVVVDQLPKANLAPTTGLDATVGLIPMAASGAIPKIPTSGGKRSQIIIAHNLPVSYDRKQIIDAVVTHKPASTSIDEIKQMRSGEIMILPSSERDYNTLVDPLRWSQQSLHKFVPRINIASEAGNICYIKNCSLSDEVSSFSEAILKKGIAVKSIKRIKVGPNKEPTYTIRAIVPKSAEREVLIKEGLYANYEHH